MPGRRVARGPGGGDFRLLPADALAMVTAAVPAAAGGDVTHIHAGHAHGVPHLDDVAEEGALVDQVRLGHPHRAAEVVGDPAHGRRFRDVSGQQGPQVHGGKGSRICGACPSSTTVEALRLAILPFEYGVRVSIGDEADPRAYIRLAAELRRAIADGTYPPGTPTPSITTLSQRYGHARQTCAKALRLLVDEGMLIRYPGLGYYVAGAAKPGNPASNDGKTDAP
jgi:DNA-binding transcriptional regulator YhcF (GntR family)